MSIENERDRRSLIEIGRIVRLVLEAMRRRIMPGVTTAHLDEVAERVLTTHGARHAPRFAFGFPANSCISVNDEAVHGIPGDRVVAAGDVVKLDVVAEKDGYHADAAITVTVPPVTEENRRLADCARAAFARAMQVARAGNRVSDIGHAIESEAHRRGFAVLRELAGHGVGRAIHEPPSIPNHADPFSRGVLTENLVIAVEPIIATRQTRIVEDSDGWTLRTADGSFAAHHEHTIVVTRGRPLVLTGG